jgi:hypothetical protein
LQILKTDEDPSKKQYSFLYAQDAQLTLPRHLFPVHEDASLTQEIPGHVFALQLIWLLPNSFATHEEVEQPVSLQHFPTRELGQDDDRILANCVVGFLTPNT